MFLLLAAVVVCFSQTTAPPASIDAISAYYLKSGQALTDPAISSTPQYKWAHLNAPLTGYLDSSNILQLGVAGMTVETDGARTGTPTPIGAASTLDIEPGIGVLCVPQVADGVMTLQCSADTAVLAYRVDPPASPGPCVDPATGKPYGAGAYATDSAYHLYFCASGVWARTVLQTTW